MYVFQISGPLFVLLLSVCREMKAVGAKIPEKELSLLMLLVQMIDNVKPAHAVKTSFILSVLRKH